MSERTELFPGVAISAREQQAWESETKKIRQAWEFGREQFSARRTTPNQPPQQARIRGAYR